MKRFKFLLAIGTLGLWTLALGQTFTADEAMKAMDQAALPLMPDGKVVGRFVLQPAVVDGAQGKVNGLFRIDTMTGQVWQLTAINFKSTDPKGFAVQGWTAVSESGAFQMGFYQQQQAEKAAPAKR